MFEVQISAAARDDIHESSLWYDEQRDGLGKEFQKEVFATLSYLRQNPSLYPLKFSEQFRFARTYRFPFFIVYEIVENAIIINAVFHTSRSPSKF